MITVFQVARFVFGYIIGLNSFYGHQLVYASIVCFMACSQYISQTVYIYTEQRLLLFYSHVLNWQSS